MINDGRVNTRSFCVCGSPPTLVVNRSHGAPKIRLQMVEPPAWLAQLANQVVACILPADTLSPVGCHYCEVDDGWEVTLFASRTEIVGGHLDGTTFASAFALDLVPLQELFDPLHEHYWQALSMAADDELGPHIGIVGDHLGHRVAVRILAAAPDRFESGRFANVYEARLDDAW